MAVHVQAETLGLEDVTLSFTVANTGIGIPADDLASIFKRGWAHF